MNPSFLKLVVCTYYNTSIITDFNVSLVLCIIVHDVHVYIPVICHVWYMYVVVIVYNVIVAMNHSYSSRAYM